MTIATALNHRGTSGQVHAPPTAPNATHPKGARISTSSGLPAHILFPRKFRDMGPFRVPNCRSPDGCHSTVTLVVCRPS